MNLFQQFKTDSNLETDGVFIDYGTEEKPIRFKIARAGGANLKFEKCLAHAIKPYERQIANDTLSKDKADAIMREVYAKSVVIGWEGVTDENDNPMPFSVENCISLFEKLPELFKDIQSCANKVAIFKTEVLESAAKN